MIGHRGVFLAPVPITIQPVETPVKCIEEAVARAVVGQRPGKHRAARHPTVVRAARVRHHLIRRVLVPQPHDCVVLRVRAQVQCR